MRSVPVTVLIAASLTVWAAAGIALAQHEVGVRQELEMQYRRLTEHDRKDLKAIARLKTSDFHAIFPDGRIGDVEVMEQYTRQFIESDQPPFNIRNTIQKEVSENGLIAVVEVLQGSVSKA